tara:strand:- start:10247 stop:11575 length:1329 start_codon:yes stop_codon:yes gene_type:complete
MHISRKDSDSLNSIITITIDQRDYISKVEEVLKNYRKTANIPGFRKGNVPIGMIKKQYEKPVIADEVNKLLQEKLDKFIKDEKLAILGNPLPIINKDLDWTSKSLEFNFEIGLSPKFEINFNTRKKVTHFKIIADDKMINDQQETIRKQYGKIVTRNEIKNEYEITGNFESKENNINTTSTFSVTDFKSKKNKDLLLESKPGDIVKFAVTNLFIDSKKTRRILGIAEDKVSILTGDVSIEIKEVNERILADLNQELFDKIYKSGTIKSVKEFKLKIAEGIEKQVEQQSDQKLLNDVTEFLIKNTKFNLPNEFLIKWIQNSGKETLSIDKAREEFSKSEKGIRYQLIEGKIIADNKLQVKIEELRGFAKEMILNQMRQYGQAVPSDKEIEEIINRILSNKDEIKRIQEQLMSKKLLNFYKNNIPLNLKKVNFESFVSEAYGKA